MIDELDLLKQDWKKREAQLPKLSFDQIYQMRAKKSHSLVRWIFYISILEFFFWLIISFIPIEEEPNNHPVGKILNTIISYGEYLSYVIIIFFIYKFYVNYRKIENTDNVRGLMRQILTTRKTVMQYVWVNVMLFGVFGLLTMLSQVVFNDSSTGATFIEADFTYRMGLLLGFVFFIGVLMALIWFFYRLLYGILLKRLNINYQELKKLEI